MRHENKGKTRKQREGGRIGRNGTKGKGEKEKEEMEEGYHRRRSQKMTRIMF